VLNDAGTYWYHPHGAGKTDLHVSKGIAGMIIVKDAVDSALALPHTYGVDDVPVIVQSKAFDILRQIAIATEDDTVMMVNGTLNPYYDAPAQVVRFRLLNGSSMRSYMFGFSGNLPFKVIASDGGLLDTPVTLTRIRMSPGERYEILLNLTGMAGQTFYFRNFGSELPAGIYGAGTLGSGVSAIPGYSANPLNGADYNIMKVNVIAATSGAVTTIPATLAPLTPWAVASVSKTRVFNLDPETPDSSKFAEGPFVINGSHFSMDTINVTTYLNNTEIWKLVNHTMVAHPFHIHDMHFFILDINGGPVPAFEHGKKDVVLVMPGDSVRFITRFEDFASETVPYMYHCHLLHHEDDGMMGQFIVSPFPESVAEVSAGGVVTIAPNPVADVLTIASAHALSAANTSVKVYSLIGAGISLPTQVVQGKLLVDTSPLAPGLYVAKVIVDGHTMVVKFVKQ
jgi:bilirubin oxidase